MGQAASGLRGKVTRKTKIKIGGKTIHVGFQWRRRFRLSMLLLGDPSSTVLPIVRNTLVFIAMKLIDISRPLYTGLAVWPGDSPVDFSFSSTKAKGSDANVGRLSMSVHAGTHTDAPYHYNESGTRIDEMPLDLFVGPARVIDIRGHALITISLLEEFDFAKTPRVLFRSDTWTDTKVFPTAWPMLDKATPAWLATKGVRLIGFDTPSVDSLTSTGMPMHHVVDRAGLCILENLDLRNALAGTYNLIALPLRIKGGDGSPIRAVLQTRD